MNPIHQSCKPRRGQRPSFTLVELLVVISIIGAMAGMVLFALNGARQDIMRSQTRATIEKINAVILERWESYRYRSVKLNIPREFTQRDEQGRSAIRARDVARIRTVLLRDMMRMELPDRREDLFYTPTNTQFVSTIDGQTYNLNAFGGRYPSSEYNILRNYFNLASIPVPYSGDIVEESTPVSGARPTWTEAAQSAECLYAIVAHSSVGGGSALENFGTSEIGDTDGDGYPEFIDAWGEPIGWVRWPAAYPSRLNQSYKLPPESPASPDAFDPVRTDPFWNDSNLAQKPWTLVPLIVSSGPDLEFGINVGYQLDDPTFPHDPNYTDVFFQTGDYRSVFIPSTDNPAIARVIDPALATDNISNHDILLE
jgi:type II secretory pathway pseudopilin PulG